MLGLNTVDTNNTIICRLRRNRPPKTRCSNSLGDSGLGFEGYDLVLTLFRMSHRDLHAALAPTAVAYTCICSQNINMATW